MAGGKGYFVEESGDELNDETFGALNNEDIVKPDFDFSGKAMSPMAHPAMAHPASHQMSPMGRPMPMAEAAPGFSSPIGIPSAHIGIPSANIGMSIGSMSFGSLSSPGRGLTAAQLEQQLLGNRPATMSGSFGDRSPLVAGSCDGQRPKTVITNLAELENSFKAMGPIRSERVMSPPPGFTSAVVAPRKPAPVITFPSAADDDDASSDPNRFLMSKYEREGIRHIHMAQLTTENPVLEDYYYQAFSKRSLKSHNQSNTPLYLPLPGLRKKPVSKSHIQNYEGALGKISSSSSKKPRQQLQLDLSVAKNQLGEDDGEDVYLAVLSRAESIHTAAGALEDALSQHDDETPFDQQLADKTRADTKAAVVDALRLEESEWSRTDIIRFVNLLALPKGRKAVFRALRILDGSVAKALLSRLVEHLEYQSVFRPAAAISEIDSFVNLILSPMVPFVSEAPAEYIVQVINMFAAKPSFLWLLFSRPGIILMCILMSRLEICKAAMDSPESDVSLGQTWPSLARHIFEQIGDRLPDLFLIPSFKHPVKGVFDGGDYYLWQFLALLALSVDAEAKKTMIVELRERILAVAQHGSPKDTANLNIFLNVLGLDSSQLAPSSS